MALPILQLKVASVSQLTSDVIAFRLEHPEGHPLPTFAAGAHIDVHLPGELTRQYSLCNHPSDSDHFLIAVKREPNSRGGSRAMHDIRPGSVVSIGPPRNSFPISRDAQFHLLLAGGIGITPLLSMARDLRRRKKPFQLEYFGRSVESTPFYRVISDELEAEVRFHVGLEPTDVNSRLTGILHYRPEDAHVYVCGPSPFITMATEIASQNWPEESVHLEHFAPQPTIGQSENQPFHLKLAQSGRELDVPAHKSILEVLRDNRIECDSSCGEGTCGSCMVAVLEGEVEHRDSFLSAKEKEQGDVMMLCVSRAKTKNLTIDL